MLSSLLTSKVRDVFIQMDLHKALMCIPCHGGMRKRDARLEGIIIDTFVSIKRLSSRCSERNIYNNYLFKIGATNNDKKLAQQVTYELFNLNMCERSSLIDRLYIFKYISCTKIGKYGCHVTFQIGPDFF